MDDKQASAKIGCVILNYNDFENTAAQVERVKDFACLDAVIVVDNNSCLLYTSQMYYYSSYLGDLSSSVERRADGTIYRSRGNYQYAYLRPVQRRPCRGIG